MRPSSLLPLLLLVACAPETAEAPSPAPAAPPAATAPTAAEPASPQAASADPRRAAELAVVGIDAGDWQGVDWLDAPAAALEEGTTLLLFWEAWCPHCRRELPEVAALHARHADEGLQVVGLTRMSRGVEEAQVRELMAGAKVAFPVGRQDGALSERFAVRGVPAAALVHDGRVVWRGHPARLDEEMLTGLLDQG